MQTITINNSLYADAQSYAKELGISVNMLLERYLKSALRERLQVRKKKRVLNDIDHAIKEFKQIQDGKLQPIPLDALLNEL